MVIELVAEDVKGNRWAVEGTITMTMGEEDKVTAEPNYVLLQAEAARSWRFDGSWFDNTSGAMFTADSAFDVRPGRLAFITLEGRGVVCPPTVSWTSIRDSMMPTATSWEISLSTGRWTEKTSPWKCSSTTDVGPPPALAVMNSVSTLTVCSLPFG